LHAGVTLFRQLVPDASPRNKPKKLKQASAQLRAARDAKPPAKSRLEKQLSMFNFLRSVFAGQNQFASGGMILMIIGGLSVYLRAVPETL